MARKPPKFEALVVSAIRRLQAAQGSSESEIANYISKEYHFSGPEVRKQLQLTLRRGRSYGIFHKSNRGYMTCDRNMLEVHDVSDCSRRRRGRTSKRKSSRRGRSRSKRRRAKRGGCNTCPRRRTANVGIKAKSRGIKRTRNRRAADRVVSKSKKSNNEDTKTARTHQDLNSSSNSKMRSKDENNNQT